jgi:outer membrane protein TolC
VLAAFQQVADTMRGLEHDAEAQDADDRSLKAAEAARKLAEYNYRAGLVNYLPVLAADIQYRQAKLAYTEAQALRLQDSTAFFIALGGGFKDLP